MRLASIVAASALALSAVPAVAQSPYGYDGGYGSGHSAYSPPRYSQGPRYGRHDFNGQADRPGDYRCDAYWDAARTDCGAAWRDQRPAYTGRYRASGYGYGYGPSVYPGAYGRPDLIYPGGGPTYGYGQSSYSHGREPRRVDWCRSAYRSYDPASGYYRTYDGRLVFCG
jgi:hypothetical protein